MTGFSRQEFDRQVEHDQTTGRAEDDERRTERLARGLPEDLPDRYVRHLIDTTID